MTVEAGDILRVVASMIWSDAAIMQNVFNASVSGGGSPWDDQDILDDAEAWLDNMYANLTSDVAQTLDGNLIHVYKYDAVGQDWDEVGFQSWGWLPTSVIDQLPRACAGLIKLGTVDPDVQGKKYIGGYTELTTVGGTLSGAVLTNLLAFGADWLTAFVGGTSGASWQPGVWSVAQTAFKASIPSITASAIVAYQRRRKRGVGI